MAATPPPQSPSALRIPDAPLHGAGYDTFEPYPTRHSARLASQRASKAKETTPPLPGSSQMQNGSPKRARKLGDMTMSTPTSHSHLPANKRRGTSKTSSIFSDSDNSHFDLSTNRASASQTLPTPAKTPSKKKVSSNLSSTSRTLFPSASKMSGRKPGPFSLESFDEDHAPSRNIEIFTDSRDRIPEASTDQSNPFYTASAAPPKTPSRNPITSPRRVTRAAQKNLDLESNEDMNFMFRGKRVMKKMIEEEEEDDDPNDVGLFASRPDLLPDAEALQHFKPLRRDDVKPRMLWERKDMPRSKPAKQDEALEDEATDEEDVFNAEPQVSLTPPPQDLYFSHASSSGTTSGRSTADSQPKRPFSNWMRKKNPDEVSPAATPAKRGPSGDAASPRQLPSVKRTRASARQ